MWSAHTTDRCNFQNTKKLETNSKRKINETYEQNSKDVDHIDDDGTNSEESTPVLWRNNRGNIVYSACLVCEKDKLRYSKYSSTKHENLIKYEVSSGEVNLKKEIMDNLESDESSLVATAKRLKIMVSDKFGHSADVLYHQAVIIS